jgi:hypothetical protein
MTTYRLVLWIILISALIYFLYVLRLFFQWLLSKDITVKEKHEGIIAQIIVFIMVQFALPKLMQEPASADGWSSFNSDPSILQTILYMLNVIVWGLFLRSRKGELRNDKTTSN